MDARRAVRALARSSASTACFFALCAEQRGFNIQAFTSYEEAMEWLLADVRGDPPGDPP